MKILRRIFWKRVVSGKQLLDGYEIPKGWGISYVRWDADFTVIHPLPLNYVVAAVRWLMHKIKLPWFVKKEQERMQGEYFKGWKEGWKDCAEKDLRDRVRKMEDEEEK